MPITTVAETYRFEVEPKNIVPLVRLLPLNIAHADAWLGVPPYHTSNEAAHTVAYVKGCDAKGVLPFMKFQLTPDLGKNLLLPEAEPIKFRTLNDRCPITRDLQTMVNHALMKGGKLNEARFLVDELNYNPMQLKDCFKMFQEALKCWIENGYELRTFKLGYQSKEPTSPMSMARDNSYAVQIRKDDELWSVGVKRSSIGSELAKHIEDIFHKHGHPASKVPHLDD